MSHNILPLRGIVLRALLLTVLLLLAAVVVTPCAAIHADEQGLRDWVRRFVGDVQHAAVAPEAHPALLYVASREGAVAALSVKDAAAAVNLTWRVVFSELPRCVVATSAGVVAVSAEGTVYVLNPTTGALDITYLLDLPLSVAQHVGCAVGGDVVRVATYASGEGGRAHLFDVDLRSEDERIAATRTLTVGEAVRGLHLTSSSLWVTKATPSGAVSEQYDVTNGTLLQSAQGACVAVAGGGEAVMQTRSALHVHGIKTASATPPSSVPCQSCQATALLRQTHSDAYAGLVTVSGADGASLVTFASGASVATPQHGDAQTSTPAVPLLAFRDGEDELVLLRTPARDLLLLSARKGVIWTRPEGVARAAATLIVDPVGQVDHLHFNKVVLFASRYGVLYRAPLARMGREVAWVIDFVAAARRLRPQLPTGTNFTVRALSPLLPGGRAVRVRVNFGEAMTVLIDLDLARSDVSAVTVVEDALVIGPDFALRSQLDVLPIGSASPSSGNVTAQAATGAAETTAASSSTVAAASTPVAPHARQPVTSDRFLYVAHASEGLVQGYILPSGASHATPTWTLRVPHPIIASTMGGAVPGRTSLVNGLHIYPNRTEEEPLDMVLNRYPMQNVIALAYYESTQEQLPTLVVLAVDAVTGSVLATTRHANVEGKVHILIAEHSIIYYFLDAYKMRYCFGVWELFEQGSQRVTKSDGATLPQIIASFLVRRTRTFSSRATRPPLVAVSVLGAYGGPLADMSLTTSSSAIARKSVVLAYETGRVAIVELRQLLAGGQMPLPRHKDRLASHVVIPSILLATHRQRLALPQHITIEPTALESSCHVLVSGLDVFYVRSSSGKPFDVLNSDFNKPLLITLFCVFAGLSFIVRYFVMRKGLYVLWK